MFGKILGIASLGEILMGVSLTKKFLSSVAILLTLVGIAAIVTSSLFIFALYACDVSLIHHGMDFDYAALLTVLLGLMVLTLVVALIVYKLKMMRTVPFTVSSAELAGTSILSALRGFYKGVTEKR